MSENIVISAMAMLVGLGQFYDKIEGMRRTVSLEEQKPILAQCDELMRRYLKKVRKNNPSIKNRIVEEKCLRKPGNEIDPEIEQKYVAFNIKYNPIRLSLIMQSLTTIFLTQSSSVDDTKLSYELSYLSEVGTTLGLDQFFSNIFFNYPNLNGVIFNNLPNVFKKSSDLSIAGANERKSNILPQSTILKYNHILYFSDSDLMLASRSFDINYYIHFFETNFGVHVSSVSDAMKVRQRKDLPLMLKTIKVPNKSLGEYLRSCPCFEKFDIIVDSKVYNGDGSLANVDCMAEGSK